MADSRPYCDVGDTIYLVWDNEIYPGKVKRVNYMKKEGDKFFSCFGSAEVAINNFEGNGRTYVFNREFVLISENCRSTAFLTSNEAKEELKEKPNRYRSVANNMCKRDDKN